MDRHGKKAKAKPSTANSQRSDLKSKAQSPLDQINQAARSAGDAQSAKPQGGSARTDPRSQG
jgi:hypothetical protein